MPEPQPSPSPQTENGSEKATVPNLLQGSQVDESKTFLQTGSSALGGQPNLNQHEPNNLEPKQERKPKQKLSMEQVLALWLQGELPDDFLSTESGKQMVPESRSMPPLFPNYGSS